VTTFIKGKSSDSANNLLLSFLSPSVSGDRTARRIQTLSLLISGHGKRKKKKKTAIKRDSRCSTVPHVQGCPHVTSISLPPAQEASIFQPIFQAWQLRLREAR
jgi:hypothetical protein